jgi:hypothetical protein
MGDDDEVDGLGTRCLVDARDEEGKKLLDAAVQGIAGLAVAGRLDERIVDVDRRAGEEAREKGGGGSRRKLAVCLWVRVAEARFSRDLGGDLLGEGRAGGCGRRQPSRMLLHGDTTHSERDKRAMSRQADRSRASAAWLRARRFASRRSH